MARHSRQKDNNPIQKPKIDKIQYLNLILILGLYVILLMEYFK